MFSFSSVKNHVHYFPHFSNVNYLKSTLDSKINQKAYHWLKNLDSTNELVIEKNNQSYFNLPHFGKNYFSQNEKIQIKECLLYDHEGIKKHLNTSKQNAFDQQEENRRIVRSFDERQQSCFAKFLNFLFMGAPKTFLDTVKIDPKQVSNLTVDCEEFKEIGAATAYTQGRRNGMEDAHLATKFDLNLSGKIRTFTLTAIFDGHEGSECADFCALNLETTLKTYLEKFNKTDLSDAGIANALSLALIDVSHSYHPDNIQNLFNFDAGCTANVALQIDQESLWIANCGDSRALMIDKDGKTIQLSEDALIEGLYQKEVLERGGTIVPVHGKSRVNGRLAVPASLGDHWSNGVITSRPNLLKLKKEEFQQAKFLIQCCDGVSEIATTEEIGSRIDSNSLPLVEKASDLVKATYLCGSTDNISVLIRQIT